jgi:4-amino-4-deoxy-L-arabinose transferase-like glycosyltransferase
MQKKHLYLFLLIWAIINLAQSALTELFHDEAHWWMFSQHLEWGFWDHPPAAPFLIFLGYEIFPNELGVRLFTVLSSLTTIYLIWDLIRPKDSLLFFGLLSSIFIFHIGGFMVAPDIPLILTTALFFWLYQRYADNDDWRIALLLGLVIAGMAYSKYHGAIVLFFTLLGNWRILGRRSFYLIPALALLLYLPHLYWQYVNDFPLSAIIWLTGVRTPTNGDSSRIILEGSF